MKVFLFSFLFLFSVSCYSQKISELKLHSVSDAIKDGKISIVGQGFDDSEFGRLPISIKDSVRKDIWNLGQNSAGVALLFRTNSKAIGAKWELLKIGRAHV